MSAPDPTDHLQLKAHLRSKNTSALGLTALLGGVLVPLFWVLDWWVLPEHVWKTLSLRGAATVYSLAVLIAWVRWRAWVVRNVDWLGFSYTTLIASSISMMCWLHAGYESPYYAGINLVVIGVGFLFTWPLRLAAPFFAVQYLFYMAPLGLGMIAVDQASVALGNQFFLLGTMVIVLAAQHHRYSLESREFFGNQALQQTKASLEKAVAALKEIDRLKSSFFNNITHELRTPLTMVLSPLDSLLEGEMGELNPPQKAYLQPIRRNALKLLKLINNLLDVAKLEEQHLRLRVERTDLRELFNEIVEHSQSLAARKEIEIRLDVRSTRDDLYVDLEQMERVLINLISNALKFTNPGGHVTVVLEDAPEGVRFSVRDTGIGIPGDKLEKIFDRFTQADGSVTRRYGGTGIGLSLAKEIVELHGGRITVESQLGEGSCFTVELRQGHEHLDARFIEDEESESKITQESLDDVDKEPREWTEMLLRGRDFRFLDIDEATERRIASRDRSAARATKILLVEDNVEVLRFLHLQLRQDHAVYMAQNGRRGLEMALAELPDVIVSDYMMPEMDGLSMVQALRQDSKTADIPVIMLSAKNRVEDRLSAREAGADIDLSKPFSPRELRSAVQQLLERRGRQASIVMREHVKSLEIISAGLAHEIHNPLSYLKNAVFMIGEKVGTIEQALDQADLGEGDAGAAVSKARGQITRMREVANRGIERINQMVQLVRRYAREGYPEEPTVLVLDSAVETVGCLIAPKGDGDVQVEMDLGADGVAVRCIPEELQQVIRNIWQNAMDVVGEQDGAGRVEVSTRREGDVAIFEVHDNGPGIPREDLQRIFTPFFTTKAPGKGMGLGLAITHQVVDRAGGAIQVESAPGAGTTFRVRLPVVPTDDPATQGDHSRASPTRTLQSTRLTR